MARSSDRVDILKREINEIELEIERRRRDLRGAIEHRDELAGVLRKKCRHTRVIQFSATAEYVVESSGCFGTTGHYKPGMGPARLCLNCGESDFTFAFRDDFSLDEDKLLKKIEAEATFTVLTAEPLIKLPRERLEEIARLTMRETNLLVQRLLREERDKKDAAKEGAAT